MRVSIYEKIDINDEQRVMLGELLHGQRKQATREEIKKFAWEHGFHWDEALLDLYTEKFGGDQQSEEVPEDEVEADDSDADDSLEDLI